MNGIRFRCRIRCRNHFLSDNGLNGSDQSYFMSDSLQNGFDHIGRGRLSFCPCNSNNVQLLCRIAEISGRSKCECVPCVFHTDHSHSRRCLYILLHDHGFCSFFCHISYILMSVWDSAADAYKHRSFFYFTGVIDQCCNFNLVTPLYYFIFQTFQ